MDPKLLDFIRGARESSISDERIARSLLIKGWKPEIVAEAMENPLSIPHLPKQDTNEDDGLVTDHPGEPGQTIIKGDKPPKKHISTKVVIIGAIILVLITALSIGTYYFITKNSPQETSEEETEEQDDTEATFTNSIIAYTYEGDDGISLELGLYDIQTRSNLTLPEVFSEDNNRVYILGPWSPDGRYLPVLGMSNNDTDPAIDTEGINIQHLYFYDSATGEASRLIDATKSDDPLYSSGTSLTYTSGWIDNSRFVYYSTRDVIQEEVTAYYVTDQGETGTLSLSDDSVRANSQLQYVLTNDYPPEIDSVTINSNELTFTPEGDIVGTMQGQLVSLIRPDDLGSSEGAYNSKMEDVNEKYVELEQQGLTDEEMGEQLLEYLEPEGDTTLKFYDVETGEIDREISLTDEGWYTQSVLIDPSEDFLIAHQTDRVFLAENERYIKIIPGDEPKIEVLFVNTLEEDTGSGFYTLLLFYGSSFFLSSDGEWVIGVRISGTGLTADDSLYIRNIETGEDITVYGPGYVEMSVYYPNLIENRF